MSGYRANLVYVSRPNKEARNAYYYLVFSVRISLHYRIPRTSDTVINSEHYRETLGQF
jgi:hypothetical protein